MNQINLQCSACNAPVIFAEDPYRVAGATKYWLSTFEEPEESILVVQRKLPSVKKGRPAFKVTREHVLAVFCSPQCGVDYYERNRAEVSSKE